MFRKLIGWLFGFTQEIAQLRKQVEELGWDTAFGMYTRPALMKIARTVLKGKKAVVFLDLDYLHSLNLKYGYTEVDRRIKAVFSSNTRSSDILAARWWSGDEVLLVLNCNIEQADAVVQRLAYSAKGHGLSFTYAVGEWNSAREDLTRTVEQLSDMVLAEKAERGQQRIPVQVSA